MVDIAANYHEIIDRIGKTAVRCGRKPEDIKLLAAAKSQSVEAVRTAIAAGNTLVGENYVQEAQEKKRQIQQAIEWHLIGHLQRNKAKAAVEIFDVIETLDSLALARELDKAGRKQGKTVRAYVEVNLGSEQSKTGIAKDEVRCLLEEAGKLDCLNVAGLMTVPPYRDDPEEVRPYFRELRELKARLAEQPIPNVDLRELSMGMSHDYEIAIEEGATIVRIGTALFGPRGA